MTVIVPSCPNLMQLKLFYFFIYLFSFMFVWSTIGTVKGHEICKCLSKCLLFFKLSASLTIWCDGGEWNYKKYMRSMFCTWRTFNDSSVFLAAKFRLMTWLSFQIIVIQHTLLKISWFFISPWIKIFMFLFTTDRSLNAFLLFFFVLLLAEVAVSVAFKYGKEMYDEFSK